MRFRLALAVLALIAAPLTSQAAFTLNLTQGATTSLIADNGAPNNGFVDDDAAPNAIRVAVDPAVAAPSFNFGVFSIASLTATTNLPGGVVANQGFTGLTITNTSNAAAMLNLVLESTGYTMPMLTAGTTAALNSAISLSSANGAASFISYSAISQVLNAANAVIASTNLNIVPTIAGTSIAGSDPDSIFFISQGTPFGLRINATLVVAPGGQFLITASNEISQVVPAPAGLILALSGAPVLLGGWYARRRKTVATAI